MKILLDTCILLWWMDGSTALSRRASALISDPENTIFVSAVSLWEIWLKVSLGKLKLPPGFDDALSAEGFEALPLTVAHARAVGSLPWHHRDPFDRMLIAQASVAGLRFLTADKSANDYGKHIEFAP